MAWSIRNYNAFVREARKEHGLSQPQAARMYQHMRKRLGRPLVGRDLSKHPRISAQEAKRAPRSEAATRAAATRAQARAAAAQKRSDAARKGWATRKERERRKAPKRPRLEGVPILAPEAARTIHDAEEWLEYYDETEDAAFEDWEATPQYETSSH